MSAEKPTANLHQEQVVALAKGDYESLAVNRLQRSCYLIIYRNDAAHVLVNAEGRAQTFRHVWQVKDWLQQSFGTVVEHLEVNNL